MYNDKLYSLMNFGIIVIILFIIIVISAFIFIMKNKLLDKRISILLCIGCLVLSILVYFFDIYPMQKDISEQSYIVYEGDFYVKECRSVSRSGTYIYIQSSNDNSPIKYKVSCDVVHIKNDTTYTGEFIYSKYSKILVDIEVE